MKALTICQPYAELIISGQKWIENRTWATGYKGPILIHAGKSKKWLDTFSPLPERMDFGAIIGVVRLEGCWARSQLPEMERRLARSDLVHHEHAEGPVCWVLKSPARFETPIPLSGAQGLWSACSESIEREIQKLLLDYLVAYK